jgi:hypothetical protein
MSFRRLSVTPARILPLVSTALLAVIAALAAFLAPAGAAPARAASPAPPVTSATALTLGNGQRVVMDAPWASRQASLTGRARTFATASPGGGYFCFYGVSQNLGPRAAPVESAAPKYTLTIKGFNLAGQPAGPDGMVQLYSASSIAWDGNNVGPTPEFKNGVVTMHVPAGKYWVLGLFPSAATYRMDIAPQVTVTGNTTVTIKERAADSEVTATTPLPAVLDDSTFSSSFTLSGGKVYEDCGTTGSTRLWVSPLTDTHTTGTLYSSTSAQLSLAKGRYAYELDSLAPPGTVASQHLSVTARDLAVVHEHFYSDTAATFPWLPLGGPARQYSETGYTGSSISLPAPGDQTVYYQAQPTAAWRPEIAGGPLTQTAIFQSLRGGQVLSTNWNAYPLHPAPNVVAPGVAPRTLPSAVRAGNKLIVDITPFSDNAAGHTGSGITKFNGVTGTGKWAIYANGTRIASAKVLDSTPFPDVEARVTLSPKPSQIKFTLTTSRKAPGSNLSGTSEDAWTWPSQAEPKARVPAPWYCGATFTGRHLVFDQHCAVQDMMTLDYQLARESLDGSTPAGSQSLDITVSHLQRSAPYPVTRIRLQVSFNNGKNWRTATLTRIHGGYRGTYTAPAGAHVSLRVTARDSHGATVTETILGAYHTA